MPRAEAFPGSKIEEISIKFGIPIPAFQRILELRHQGPVPALRNGTGEKDKRILVSYSDPQNPDKHLGIIISKGVCLAAITEFEKGDGG